MLGQALSREASQRGITLYGAARRGCDYSVDLADGPQIAGLIKMISPDTVINAAALTSLDACEQSPGEAYLVNGRAVSWMAEACRSLGCYLVQISTDHYFTGHGNLPHDEDAKICLVNEYARTKYAGEAFAMTVSGALVIRTNMTGRRGWPQPTFYEWVIGSLRGRAQMSLFEDYFTSTIDAGTLSRAIFDLIGKQVSGVLNVASRQVASKKAFVEEVSRALRLELDFVPKSVRTLAVLRAESSGLDVSRAEAILGYALPDLRAVVAALTAQEMAA
jgi:dTDP-4-dehydrorhamnose reductase